MASIIKADTLQSTTANVFVLNSSGTEYARFDSSGNMGIGTASPGAKLDVRGSSTFLINAANPTAWVSSDSSLTTQSMYMQVNTTSSDTRLGSYTSHPLAFLTNNTERMRIDSSGRVTMPYQPTFYGGRNAGQVGTNTVFVMNDAQINIGSCYNTTTGEFTCPIAGIYYASFGVMSVGAFVSDIDFFSIQKNNVSVVNNYLTGRNAQHQRVSATVLINCAANDTIRFRTGGIAIYGGSSTHSFGSIYLMR